ncbi:hypothetical protein CLOSTASPAR_06487 [[Clostridium] asparagiforme DSM 15981]|uniref:Uncharacterized protein n=1 Tax=[Clostridium] asparagiforme DSM 15981 TaxID=518636 RepID=C0DB32_9FIRM|nr:hypothetical protein CLOSTASPAR_06487 [[Clostridium] asparagiforme DSM 15981]
MSLFAENAELRAYYKEIGSFGDTEVEKEFIVWIFHPGCPG